MGCDNMNNAQHLDETGPLEARYLAFLETITNLRPSLHRYCARMTSLSACLPRSARVCS
jgi:hypothetical protein